MTYSSEVLADSPLAYYRLGEASGATMVDSSGNGRDGAWDGTPGYGVTGLLTSDANTCVDINSGVCGVTSYASWMNVAAFTVEALTIADSTTGDRIIASRTNWNVGPTGSQRVFHLAIINGFFHVGMRGNGGANIDTSTGIAAATGTKYHVALTFDGTTIRFYKDGTQVWTSTALSGQALGQPTETSFVVGAESFYTGGTGGYDGRIDEVAFYGTALSPSRIAAHYQASKASPYAVAVLTDAPLGYYRLGESSGTTLVDSSGNGRDGTYSGSYTLGATSLLVGDADTSVDWLGGVGTVAKAAWMETTGLTIEALIQTDTLTSTDVIAARADWAVGFGPAYSWALYREGNHFLVEVFRDNTSTRVGVSSGAILTGTTYHVAATYDGTTVRLYVNGAEVGTPAALAAPLSPGTSPLTIGRTPYAGDGGFDGRIDEVAFYGAALSSTRIAAHYTAATSAGGATVGLSLAGTLPAIQSDLTLASFTDTRTANRVNGRIRDGRFIDESEAPVTPLPAHLTRAARYDKALAYPTPTLVDGRPT